MSQPANKKIRKANFSSREMDVLLDQIAEEKEVLFSPLSNENTNKMKRAKWASIAAKVSECEVAARSVNDVRDKWKHIKSEVLKRINDQQKTGGGPPATPSPYQDSVLAILGDKSEMTDGIKVTLPDVFAASQNEDTFISQQPSESSVFEVQVQLPSTSDGYISSTPQQMQASDPSQSVASFDYQAASPGSAAEQLDESRSTAQSLDATPGPRATTTPAKSKYVSKPDKRKGKRHASPLRKAAVPSITDVERQYFETAINFYTSTKEKLDELMPVVKKYFEQKEKLVSLKIKVLEKALEKSEKINADFPLEN